ncbi:unnamed protein product [Malus baccata var. baccata]
MAVLWVSKRARKDPTPVFKEEDEGDGGGRRGRRRTKGRWGESTVSGEKKEEKGITINSKIFTITDFNGTKIWDSLLSFPRTAALSKIMGLTHAASAVNRKINRKVNIKINRKVNRCMTLQRNHKLSENYTSTPMHASE